MQIQFHFNECFSAPTEVSGTYINCDESNDVPALFCTPFPKFSYVNLEKKKKNITQKCREKQSTLSFDISMIYVGLFLFLFWKTKKSKEDFLPPLYRLFAVTQ